MDFLTPWTGAIAAAISVPLLVALYFLKLRRTEAFVSSTLLWKRAVQDLQVNAPFQRLRKNLLLLIQLLVLAAVLLAMAGPVLALRGGDGKRYVLLIDRSASMNALDGSGRSRLEIAREQALRLVEGLADGGLLGFGGEQAMVVAFDDRAKVLCTFTNDRGQLRRAIERIEPSDGGSKLVEAVQVAQAFAQSPGEAMNNRPVTDRAELVLFSDGRIDDLDRAAVAAEELTYYAVGSEAPNVGIERMQIRRSFERPQDVHVFAAVANWGSEPVSFDLQLSLDGAVRSVRSVRAPAAQPEGQGGRRPGRAGVAFTFEHLGSGVVEVRRVGDDALASDDVAWSVLRAPRSVRATLVTTGNAVLVRALRSCPLAELTVVTPNEYEALPPEHFLGDDAHDVIVLDHYQPTRLPRAGYLVFGPAPAELGIPDVVRQSRQIVIDWRADHPALRHVNFDNLLAERWRQYDLPREARILAEMPDGPAIVSLTRQGREFLLVAVDVLESNWPFDVGFVMFCYNAVEHLSQRVHGGRAPTLAVGEAIEFRPPGRTDRATVSGPGATGTVLRRDGSGAFRFPATDRAGVYVVRPDGQPPETFAVNLAATDEGDLRPRTQLALTGESVTAESAPPGRANRPLWPYLAMAALVLVCVEWLVYNSKARL